MLQFPSHGGVPAGRGGSSKRKFTFVFFKKISGRKPFVTVIWGECLVPPAVGHSSGGGKLAGEFFGVV